MLSALRNVFRRSNSTREPAARSRLGVLQLDDRIVPAGVTYHNGPLLTHVQIADVFYGQTWDADDAGGNIRNTMIDFTKSIVKSPYMAMLGEYGVGRGTVNGGYDPVRSGPKNGDTVTEQQIRDMLANEITSGRVPAPAFSNSQQLYIVYLAPGVVSQFDQMHGYGGHHSGFFYGNYIFSSASPGYIYNSFPAYYVVIPETTTTSISLLTGRTSHELAEAVTDPDTVSGWREYGVAEGEIGDKVDGQYVSFVTGGVAYTVQKEWSNFFNRGIVPVSNSDWMLNQPFPGGVFGAVYNYGKPNDGPDVGWSIGVSGPGMWVNYEIAPGDYAGWFEVSLL
jgi:hypothetical protein